MRQLFTLLLRFNVGALARLNGVSQGSDFRTIRIHARAVQPVTCWAISLISRGFPHPTGK